MKVSCPICESTKLIPQKGSVEVFSVPRVPEQGTIKVADCEYYLCPVCGADPVFTDQIRRNEDRIKSARDALNR